MQGSEGALSKLRRSNIEHLVNTLRSAGTLSQAELARQTGLSEATVSNLIRELIRQERVQLLKGRRNGRRANLLQLSAVAGTVALVASVERHQIRAAAVEGDGRILVERSRLRRAGTKYAQEMSQVLDLVGETRRHDSVAPRSVAGLGLALCVSIDPTLESVPADLGTLPAFDPSWYGADVTGDLSAKLGMPVCLINDGDAALLAEARWGAARGCRDALYLFLGEGVGGGVLLGGRLYRGGSGGIGELGHSSNDATGQLCVCGNRGCLETKIGGEALLGHIAALHGEDLSLARLSELAASGDAGCTRIVADAARDVVLGLANVIAVLAPERFILGGDLAVAGAALLDPVRRGMHAMASPRNWRGSVVLGELGTEAVLLGAARLALEGSELYL